MAPPPPGIGGARVSPGPACSPMFPSSWLGAESNAYGQRSDCPALVGRLRRYPSNPRCAGRAPILACEPMTEFRNNVTGTPYPSAKSDAILHTLGVRCIGRVYPALATAHY